MSASDVLSVCDQLDDRGYRCDTSAENLAFAEAQNFPFHLLSDVDRAVGAQYEVVRAPGESYPEYPMRHSYLIDPDGRINRRYEVTDVASHAADVIRDLEAAQTES